MEEKAGKKRAHRLCLGLKASNTSCRLYDNLVQIPDDHSLTKAAAIVSLSAIFKRIITANPHVHH